MWKKFTFVIKVLLIIMALFMIDYQVNKILLHGITIKHIYTINNKNESTIPDNFQNKPEQQDPTIWF